MKQSKFPPGWDEKRVRAVLRHYERQTEEESIAEDEAASESPACTDDPGIDALSAAETEDRIDAFERGEIGSKSAEEVFNRIAERAGAFGSSKTSC